MVAKSATVKLLTVACPLILRSPLTNDGNPSDLSRDKSPKTTKSPFIVAFSETVKLFTDELPETVKFSETLTAPLKKTSLLKVVNP